LAEYTEKKEPANAGQTSVKILRLSPVKKGRPSPTSPGRNSGDANVKVLRRRDAAQYVQDNWGLPCAYQTLAKLAVIGGAPVFRKAGRYPLYRLEDLDGWAAAKIGHPRTSTSDIPDGAGVEL
jgi:hypothetical protein